MTSNFDIRPVGIFNVVSTHLSDGDVFDSAKLKSAVQYLIENDMRNVVMDLGNLKYLYSDTINAFVTSNRQMLESSGRMAVLTGQPRVQNILKRAGLNNVMRIYRSEEEILADSGEILRQTVGHQAGEAKKITFSASESIPGSQTDYESQAPRTQDVSEMDLSSDSGPGSETAFDLDFESLGILPESRKRNSPQDRMRSPNARLRQAYRPESRDVSPGEEEAIKFTPAADGVVSAEVTSVEAPAAASPAIAAAPAQEKVLTIQPEPAPVPEPVVAPEPVPLSEPQAISQPTSPPPQLVVVPEPAAIPEPVVEPMATPVEAIVSKEALVVTPDPLAPPPPVTTPLALKPAQKPQPQPVPKSAPAPLSEPAQSGTSIWKADRSAEGAAEKSTAGGTPPKDPGSEAEASAFSEDALPALVSWDARNRKHPGEPGTVFLPPPIKKKPLPLAVVILPVLLLFFIGAFWLLRAPLYAVKEKLFHSRATEAVVQPVAQPLADSVKPEAAQPPGSAQPESPPVAANPVRPSPQTKSETVTKSTSQSPVGNKPATPPAIPASPATAAKTQKKPAVAAALPQAKADSAAKTVTQSQPQPAAQPAAVPQSPVAAVPVAVAPAPAAQPPQESKPAAAAPNPPAPAQAAPIDTALPAVAAPPPAAAPVPMGTLFLSSLPGGADILVDGKNSGRKTPTKLELPSGNHHIEMIKGAQKAAVDHVVGAGKNTALHLNLH